MMETNNTYSYPQRGQTFSDHVSRFGIRYSVLVYILSVLCFGGISAFRWYGFPLDDAWIHRVYSQAVAYGHWFSYNPGQLETGATSPLWVILTAPVHWLQCLGTEPTVIGVKLLSISLGLGIVILVFLLSQRTFQSSVAGLVAASLLACDSRFLMSLFSGMEITLLVFLWVAAFYAIIKKKITMSVIFFSLLPVVRPESITILGFMALYIVLRYRHIGVGKVLLYGGILIIPWLMWSLYCYVATDHWLPSTYYVKSKPFSIGIRQLHQMVALIFQHGWFQSFCAIPGFIIGIVIISRRHREALPWLLFFLVAPVVFIASIVSTRNVQLHGYYWTRWADPASLILLIPFCMGVAAVSVGIVDGYFKKWSHSAMMCRSLRLMAIALFLLSLDTVLDSWKNRRYHTENDAMNIHRMNVIPGVWIGDNTPEDALVGVNDAGAIRYFGKRTTIDIVGLNRADIVFNRVGCNDYIRDSLDYLAVYPWLFHSEKVKHYFKPIKVFSIPYAEYSICECPKQTRLVIFKRKERVECQ